MSSMIFDAESLKLYQNLSIYAWFYNMCMIFSKPYLNKYFYYF